MMGNHTLVAVCHPSEEGWRQVLHRERARLGPSDTVCQQEQGRGRKLVTEEPKPVGSGRFRDRSQDSDWALGTSWSSSFSLRGSGTKKQEVGDSEGQSVFKKGAFYGDDHPSLPSTLRRDALVR